MSDNEVSVKFSGDTAQLNAAVSQAKTTLTGFSAVSVGLKSSMDALTAATNAQAQASQKSSAGFVTQAAAAVGVYTALRLVGTALTDVNQGMTSVQGTVLDASLSLSKFFVTAAIDGQRVSLQADADAFHTLGSAVSGTVSAVAAAPGAFAGYFTAAAYAERSSRLFAQANDGIRASVGQAIIGIEMFSARMAVAFSSLPKTELAAISAAGGLDKFIAAVDRVGGTGSAKDTLVEFTAQLEQIPDTTKDVAASIEGMLGSLPGYTVELNSIVVNWLQQTATSGADALVKVKALKDAFADTNNGGKTLAGMFGTVQNLDDLQVEAQRVAAALNPGQAAAFYTTLIAKIKERAALEKAASDENVANLQRIPLIGSAVASLNERLTGAVALQKDFGAASMVAAANLELQLHTAQSITDALSRQADYEKAIGDNSRHSREESAQDNVKALNNGSSQGRPNDDAEIGNDRDLFIRTLLGEAGGEGAKGMEAVAAVIKNRVDSSFDGMKTYRDVILEGGGKQFNTWSPGNAAGASVRAISTDDPKYAAAAAVIDKLAAKDFSDPTNGATSFYNPKTATNPFPMTNVTSIGNHNFGNTKGSPQVRDDGDDDERTEALQKQAGILATIENEKRGGTEADVTALENSQQNAKALGDQVVQARALLDAKRKDLARAQGKDEDGNNLQVEQDDGPNKGQKFDVGPESPTAVMAAQKAVAEAEQSLRDKSVAQDKATNDLKSAQAIEGSKERYDIQTAGLDKELAAAGDDVTKRAGIEKQKVDLTRAYNAQQVADATETENEKYESANRGFKQAQELIKEQAKTSGISSAQEQTDLRASYAAQSAMAVAHFAELEKLNAANPAMVRKYALAGAQEAGKIDDERVASARAANQAIEQDYKQSFESVGSSISSSLMAIIEKTGTLKNLMQNVAKNIVQQFLSAGVKMVADWTAHQAYMTLSTIWNQLSQTTAVTAGETARTAAVGAGEGAQAGIKEASVLKSIASSVAETYAGVFGFLSPIMGPLAAGPAAVAAGTVGAVRGLVGFDTGTWALGSDMVAQVHKGEMIVPAAQTPWAQSLMSNAAGAAGGSGAGSGSGGGDMHIHLNVSAIDGQSVVALFRNNSTELAKMIGKTMRQNPSTRGAY